MTTKMNFVSLVGSERSHLLGAHRVGMADPDERVCVTVLVRRRPTVKSLKALIEENNGRTLQQRSHLHHQTFAAQYGADPHDLEQVEDFAQAHGLDVVEVQPSQRRLVLSGTVAKLSAAFHVQLARYEHSRGVYRGRTGPVQIPEPLAPIVQGVFGLGNRPQLRTHFRVLGNSAAGAKQSRVGNTAFSPLQIAQLYNFPADLDGRGQCIGLIELGGGYHITDLTHYFAQLGIPRPKTTSRSIDGGHNHPNGDPNGPDGEVQLDIEVAGALAPKAKLIVYFAPNTDAGFLDAITTAIHDTHNTPSVISISWGAAESEWTAQAMQAMDDVFQDAVALGITVCCASGANGSSDGVSDGRAYVDFPASSPHVLACGGTHLEGMATAISKESVWNDGAQGGATGGGVSEVFALPAWQAGAHVPPSVNPGKRSGRGVPDVAGNADPVTGYQVLIDGQSFVIGGTSAVAPLWAGLIALFNQKLGRSVGYLNPSLYALPTAAQAFHDITTGNNDAYLARPGWDACTGLGSPNAVRLLSALAEQPRSH
jgi:kumamolisin